MEKQLKKVSDWLIFMGKICAYATLLFAIEVGFLFGLVALILVLNEQGADVSGFAIFAELHWFLWKFAFVMFTLGALFWMFSEISKMNREKRARWEQRRREAIVEVKEAFLDELKKSRRRK